MIEGIIFWVFALAAVAGALAVVFHRSIIYASLALIVVFLSIAAFFVLNNADFLAVAQTIVYGVGLTIILLFGVMFTGDKPVAPLPAPQRALFGVIVVSVLTLLVNVVTYPFVQQVPSQAWVQTVQAEGTTKMLGSLLYQNYAIPFEVASVLLLVAMIGAIVIAKKRFETEPASAGPLKIHPEAVESPESSPLMKV
jgi:NADH-quinone oxidoreductase subunit J